MFVRGVGVNRTVYKPQSSEDTDQARKRKELGIGANDFVILCVAELIERKNQQQLIKSVASLQQSGPVTCLLVGSGEAEQKLKSMVQSLGLERAVRFLGYRKDVPQLIKIADAVTLLSRQEGLPRALMEGLAAGKPLVATNVRGNRDLVRHGENGFIVELDSIEETVSAFGSLLKDRQLAEQMGEKSLALAHLYDLATISEEMGMIYRKAVDIPHTYSKQEVIG
ncbi:glycosyltransferase [Domibacillus indicus]|uniref:glycosyltransferase n=1 Tax=Domibacillus indicus TaxID=1437523 RepID=UPI0038B23ADB